MDLSEYGSLTPIQRDSILALAHRAESHDGVSPLNEAATLALTHVTGHHLLAQNDSTLLGYAFVEPTVDASTAEGRDDAAQIVVDPEYRRQGIATDLVTHLGPDTDLWAFGNLSPAQSFASARAFTPVRGLVVMELPVIPPQAGSLDSMLDKVGQENRPRVPSFSAAAPGGGVPHWRRMGNPNGISHPSTRGVLGALRLNLFLGLSRTSKLVLHSTCVEVGSRRGRPPHHEEDRRMTTYTPEDLEALVRLNARSFADHPEQGHMTIDDFQERMEQDWFDPTGLMIARDDDGTMIGFHWTKVENGIGEVYVLGVDPDHAGAGVGSALLDAGLAYLSSRNVTKVRLWVDDDNHIAQSLYVKSGFSPIRHDIRYRRLDDVRHG